MHIVCNQILYNMPLSKQSRRPEESSKSEIVALRRSQTLGSGYVWHICGYARMRLCLYEELVDAIQKGTTMLAYSNDSVSFTIIGTEK